MDAFDADVLVYATARDHALGRRVAALFPTAGQDSGDPPSGIGSVLLVPEVLGKPLRSGFDDAEFEALVTFLTRLDLHPLDRATAELAAILSGKYKLRAADAGHLATAVTVGADRFITNNRRDFPTTISEIQITYPADLPDIN